MVGAPERELLILKVQIKQKIERNGKTAKKKNKKKRNSEIEFILNHCPDQSIAA